MGKAGRYFSEPDPTSTPGVGLKTKSPLSNNSAIKPEISTVVASKFSLNKVKKFKFGKNKKKLNKNKKKDAPVAAPPPLPSKELMAKYGRGKGLSSSSDTISKSKQGKGNSIRAKRLIRTDEKIKHGLEHAARSEILLLEDAGKVEVDEGEHTLQLRQCDLSKHVDIASATKGFHLSLDQFGPYVHRYTSNGRQLVLGGRKGHIAAFDWVTKSLMCEMSVMESVHDVAWLHNENMFAVAQKEWTYIYDNQGIEIHCLKKMDRVIKLDFLPYHFLLVGGHQSGFLSWVDVSIGKIVTQFNGRQGAIGMLTTNPGNAVVHCGHSNGTVTLWAPTVRSPLASILCHGAPLSALAVDSVGRLMATSGRDGSLRIWDLRNSFAPLSSVKVGTASSLDFSQRGLLAMGTSNQSLIFSEIGHRQKPYLKHVSNGHVSSLKFCPFEDVLGVGTDRGFDSIIVPGAGEPNFDALERNPFQTKTQRREAEVKSLLEKIQPELISLDNNILGEVDTETLKEVLDKKPIYVKKADIELTHRRKRKNAKIPKIKEALRSELNLRQVKEHKEKKKEKSIQLESDDPLARFVKKKN